MSLLKDPSFMLGVGLISIALGRTALFVVGGVYVLIALLPYLG